MGLLSGPHLLLRRKRPSLRGAAEALVVPVVKVQRTPRLGPQHTGRSEIDPADVALREVPCPRLVLHGKPRLVGGEGHFALSN